MGGKASNTAFKPHEVEGFARQQQRMNNANITNPFGSTTTIFGPDDQAQITQTLSEPMQNIINSQMGFVSQGPSQLGSFSSPFLDGLLQGTAEGLARRGGYQMPQVGDIGAGFQGFSPQFNQAPEAPTQTSGPGTQEFVNPLGPADMRGDGSNPLPSANGDLSFALKSANAQPGGVAFGLGQDIEPGKVPVGNRVSRGIRAGAQGAGDNGMAQLGGGIAGALKALMNKER